MGIREQEPSDFVAPFTRQRHGSKEAELAWLETCKAARGRQTYKWAVAPGCTVGTVAETTLKEDAQVTPADVGGGGNLARLVSIGVVLETSERQAATNRGEYEYVFLKPVTHAGLVRDGGLNSDEIDVPAEDSYQGIDPGTGRVVTRQGRPAVDGAAKAEEWIKQGLAARARLRRKVVAEKAKELFQRSGGGKGKA